MFLFFFFFLAFAPLLVNNGIFWDDWVHYDQTAQTLARTFNELGSPPAGYLVRILASAPPRGGEVVHLRDLPAAMLITYQILVKTRLFGKNAAFFSRFSRRSSRTTSRGSRRSAPPTRRATCCSFWGSLRSSLQLRQETAFEYCSLACSSRRSARTRCSSYYLVPVLYIAYSSGPRCSRLGQSRGSAWHTWISSCFQSCSTPSRRLLRPVRHLPELQQSASTNIAQSPSGFLLESRVLVVRRRRRSERLRHRGRARRGIVLIAVPTGSCEEGARGGGGRGRLQYSGPVVPAWRSLFYLGVLPYLAIGRQGPTFGSEWESRDQLLLGIGAAFMLYYGVTYLFARLHLGVRP